MKKIVLDTNCLLMSLPRISPYRLIWFVDSAFTAGASCIVSNDAHFKILNEIKFPKIFVLRIKEFIDLLLKENNKKNSNQ